MSVAASTTAGASSVDAWTTTSTWKQLGSLSLGYRLGRTELDLAPLGAVAL